jgi:Tfp pilus assembly protein PilF
VAAPRRPFWTAIAALILVFVTAGIYVGRLGGPFLFDDVSGIVDNPSIRAIASALTPPDNTPMAARPLPNLTLAVNYAVAGLNPPAYHRFNLALHCVNAWLAFALVSGLLSRGRFPQRVRERSVVVGFIAAMLWAVHPVAVELVLYAVQRTELCAALCYLATLWAVVRSDDARRPPVWYAVAWVACVAGMASKAVMVTAPVLALFLDRAFLAGSFGEALRRRRGLYVGLALGWVVLALLQAGSPRAGSIGPPSLHYLAAQSEIVPRYLLAVLTAHGNVLDYGMLVADQTYGNSFTYLFTGTLVMAALVGTFTHPRLGYVGTWVFGILAPSSSIVSLPSEIGAERRIYLPALAVVVLIVLAVHAVVDRVASARRGASVAVAVVLVAVVVVALGARSRSRTEAFACGRAFWETAARERPQNPRAHYNLGEAYREGGEMGKAVVAYEEALSVDPDYRRALVNLGGALVRLGRPAQALEPLERAVELAPGDFGAHYNLATALILTGDPAGARAHLERAVAIEPGHRRARARLEQIQTRP